MCLSVVAVLCYLNSTESVFNLNKLKQACSLGGIALPPRFETIDHVNDWVDVHGDDGTSESWRLRSYVPPSAPEIRILTKGSPEFERELYDARGFGIPDPSEIREGRWSDGERGYEIVVVKRGATYISSLVFTYR